jgi:hypothetical protein
VGFAKGASGKINIYRVNGGKALEKGYVSNVRQKEFRQTAEKGTLKMLHAELLEYVSVAWNQ